MWQRQLGNDVALELQTAPESEDDLVVSVRLYGASIEWLVLLNLGQSVETRPHDQQKSVARVFYFGVAFHHPTQLTVVESSQDAGMYVPHTVAGVLIAENVRGQTEVVQAWDDLHVPLSRHGFGRG